MSLARTRDQIPRDHSRALTGMAFPGVYPGCSSFPSNFLESEGKPRCPRCSARLVLRWSRLLATWRARIIRQLGRPENDAHAGAPWLPANPFPEMARQRFRGKPFFPSVEFAQFSAKLAEAVILMDVFVHRFSTLGDDSPDRAF